jgi:hypothetical protein
MSFYSPQTSKIEESSVLLKAFNATEISVKYRDTSGLNSSTATFTADKLELDLSSGFNEQILTGSARFKVGSDTFLDRNGLLYRAVNPANNSGIQSGLIQYGTGIVKIDSWTPNADNTIQLESLTMTTDLPPVNRISFRTPIIPIRVQSLTVVATSLEYGQLTLTADEYGKIETNRAHGSINYDNGLVNINFYAKTEITAANRTEIETNDWYDVLLEYDDAGKTYINVPVWIDASAVRYNAIAYTYIQLESLTMTTDLPPVNRISFRTPIIPIRVQSLTVVATSLEYGQLTLTADEYGKIETNRAHGSINYDNGLVNINFYAKTEITAANRTEIETNDWYDVLLEYDDAGKTYINVPVWIDASAVRYNAIAYTYIPLDADVIGLSATRLPLDGRVPIFRVGGVGIVSASKSFELPDHVPGKTYDLPDQRIAWCELEDASGIKVPFDMYTVDYNYGRFTLNGDFALNALVAPLKSKYRYQDMGLIRDVQINGQLTFTKPLTHNYEAESTVVGSALIIDEMQARYTRKFVQQTWNSLWADEAAGTPISANYNDSIYPLQVTNQGAIQERWAIVFTDATNFRCIGEYTGQIGTGTISADFFPFNPTTNAPYFLIKKEGWGTGWASGNVLRFNTIAANYPVWVIRTVMQSEPSQISDQFQIMLRGDIDRAV